MAHTHVSVIMRSAEEIFITRLVPTGMMTFGVVVGTVEIRIS